MISALGDEPRLHLSLTSENNVQFQRGQSIDDSLWEQAVAWWADGRESDPGKDKFVVSLNDFIVRMGWLRSVWTSQNRSVLLSDELRKMLSSSKDEQALFESLIHRRVEAKNFNVKGLGLIRKLTPEQLQNVQSLVSMGNGANFSVPGAGKTTTALVTWRYLNLQNSVGRLLVVSPRSAFEAWESEPELCFSDDFKTEILGESMINPDTQILLVNYEQLERVDRRGRVGRWVAEHKAMVVLDEAHRVKGGGNSVRWRACRDVVRSASRVDLLTGTPMPQSLEDLRNLLCLSWPRIPRTYFSDSKLQSLSRGGVFVRTTKAELSLPKPLIIEEIIEPGLIQEQIYSALSRTYVGTFQLPSAEAALMGRKGRAVMTLLAAATNPGLLLGIDRDDSYLNLEWPPREVSSSEHLMNVISTYARYEMPRKYEWVRRFVEIAANEDRKVLIWSTFIGNLHALQRVLRPFSPALVYGATSNSERAENLKKFRTDSSCSVLLTNPQTLGEGISLHKTCHDAIYIDRSYNAGLYLQSLDRIHRLGLAPEDETRIHILGTAGTIDQRVSVRLRDKVDRLARALDDVGLVQVSMPDDELVLNREEVLGLNSLDLDDLFAHLNGDDVLR